ncbi:hypothetical protein [Oleisolibacter albus]|uniref:hypothetical protein n=1 Tax=Oleisolibacter albus TaxID=2171757 RepID=UPI0012D81788|nr:hypothetical protein [Oleisolibacter albus]
MTAYPHQPTRHGLRNFLVRETYVMGAVTGILCVFFAWLFFSGQADVPVWGGEGIMMDQVPGTILPVLAICLITPAAIRVRRRKGEIPDLNWEDVTGIVRLVPRNLLVRTVVLCAVWFIVFVGGSYLALWAGGWISVPFHALLGVKAAYGVLLGASLCPFVLLPSIGR